MNVAGLDTPFVMIDVDALEENLESVGDEHERIVRWKGNPSFAELWNRPIRLRFVMQDADLYSLRFADRAVT